jgi:predicted permease
MDAELHFHLESLISDHMHQGLNREEAEHQARCEFGPLELAKDECRDQRPAEALADVLRDARYALRSLRKSPGFTMAAILTLGLLIGANAALFQLLDAIRLRSLPVRDPERLTLVVLAHRKRWRGSMAGPHAALTNPLWERFRDRQDAFSGVLAWGSNDFGLDQEIASLPAHGLFVSGEFFRVLGVQPLLGRVFTAADDHRGCGLAGAVVSYEFWQRQLGGAPSIIGRKLTLNFQKVEVVGVTPANFSGLEIGRSFDVAVPICSQEALWSDGNWLNEGTVWWLTVMGRIAPGRSIEMVNARLEAVSPSLFEATLPPNYPPENVPDYLRFKLRAAPGGGGVCVLRTQYSEPLMILLAGTALVLLIACTNLANLILARASAREHDFAVRLAIGASRGRLLRQLTVENALLALAGATVGLLLAGGLSRFLVAFLGTEGNPVFLDLRMDARLLAFVASSAVLTCIAFGLVPALRATRVLAGDAMKAGGHRLSTSRQGFRFRQVLVVSQVALSLVLLFGALLFSDTLRNLLAVDTGFQPRGIIAAWVDFSRLKIPPARRVEFKRDLLGSIRSAPGVASAVEVGIIPLGGGGTENNVWLDGTDPTRKTFVNFNQIGEGYLRTMGIALLSGRDFSVRDTVSSPRVAIVNRTFVRRLGLRGDPVGQRFRREATPSEPELVFEIVGLVRDTKYFDLREEYRPIAFLAATQDSDPGPFTQVLIRSAAPLRETSGSVKRAVAGVSPLAGFDSWVLVTTIRDRLLRERLMATLSGFFGALGALIAAIGLYGVMSYLVVRRTGEIGVRTALGASRGAILAMVLRQGGRLLGIGLGVGLLLALAAARVVRSLLFGVQPHDIRTLGLALVLLAAIGLASSYLPARRAASLAPITALREE